VGLQVCVAVREWLREHPNVGILKGAFIQIMPLTWDALLLLVVDQAPLAYDLTRSGQRRGSPSKT
jgi:hypothetical protein